MAGSARHLFNIKSMKIVRNTLIITTIASLIAGCKPEEAPSTTQAEAPALLSSTPSDGATDLQGSAITAELIFDQNIRCSATASVTISGEAKIDRVFAGTNNLLVDISSLAPGQTYTLSIPAGIIRGFKENQKETPAISLNFSTKAAPVETHYDRDPMQSLTNKDASAGASKLYAFLLENYGKKTLSGAMGGTAWETSYTDMISNLTGKYPAIVGFDYLFNNWPPKHWPGCPDYSDITPVKKAWEAHNIIQIGWHWCVPPAEGTTDINKYSYNTKTFGVKNALTEGTWQNAEMKKQLAQIAGYLTLLRDAGIPVLFRPLHEAAGDYGWGAWFWWGYDGAEACKQLWRYMHDLFTNEYKLNNLIWVWTVQTSDKGQLAGVDKLEEWYPGDEYCDIVGADLYVAKNTTQSQIFQLVNDSVKGKKIVVISEFGNLLDIDGFFGEDAPWGYFMNWCNFENGNPVLYAKNSDGSYTWNNSVEDWKAALGNSHTLNRNDISL